MRVAVLLSPSSSWARQLTMRLVEQGVSVDVIHFSKARADEYMRVDDEFLLGDLAELRSAVTSVNPLRTRFGYLPRYFTCIPDFRRIKKRLRPDIVLVLYGGAFSMMTWMSGVRPYAVYLVGSDVLTVGRLGHLVTRRTVAGAALVLANGAHLARIARAKFGKEDIESLYIGVDTRRFAPGQPAQDRCRIVCTRGFAPVYNNEQIIESLRHMTQDNFELTFVSSGPDIDQARQRAAALPGQRPKQVKFLGGANDVVVVEELRQSHIYVSASRSDGTSTSLLEALACGLYPVVTDIPANREWIENGRNGTLVALDDAKGMAAALDLAMSSPDMRARAAPVNRLLIQKRADSFESAAALIRLMEEAIRKAGPR